MATSTFLKSFDSHLQTRSQGDALRLVCSACVHSAQRLFAVMQNLCSRQGSQVAPCQSVRYVILTKPHDKDGDYCLLPADMDADGRLRTEIQFSSGSYRFLISSLPASFPSSLCLPFLPPFFLPPFFPSAVNQYQVVIYIYF